MSARSIKQWFDEYGESHQNQTNKLIHWICVPAIFFSIVCLLHMVKIYGGITLATLVMLFAVVFYVRLSIKLTLGLIVFYCLCLWGAQAISQLSIPVWQVALAIFVVAWIGQFIGHHIEGKKPSFIKDVQFLLIGPAWLLGFVYAKFGVKLN